MSILVTGATGLIGNALRERLLASGQNVRALVLPGREAAFPPHPKMQIVVGGLADRAILETAMRGVDIVFHLAGLLPGNPQNELAHVNVEGTQNVVQACVRNGVKRLVFISSTSVYRDASLPFAKGIDENAPLRTLGATDLELYGLSKVEAERRIVELRPNGRFNYVIIRAPIVYGAADGWDKRLIDSMRSRPLLAASAVTALRALQCVHIDDLVQGLILAGGHKAAVNQVFNMAGAELFSPRDAAQLSYVSDAFDDGPVTHADLLKYDIRKARSMIGYAPVVRFAQRAPGLLLRRAI